MQRFLEHFDRLTVVSVMLDGLKSGKRFVSLEDLSLTSRVRLVPMPVGWRLGDHRRALPGVRQTFDQLIPQHRYLSFSISGYFGDWGRVAAEEAIRLDRRFTLWIERVESSVGWVTARRLRHKARFLIDSVPRIISDRRLLPKASAVLCQGQDTVLAYQRYNPVTLQMTNVHTRASELPPQEQVEAKARRVQDRLDLRLVYAGRLADEKAPLHWIRALHAALKLGCDVRAVWFGEGSLRQQALQLITELGIGDRVKLAGVISDRTRMLHEIHEADALLFTHISREPSRILVEAVNMGTPIIGYASERAKELVARHGGGAFSPMKDPAALGQLIAAIAADRSRLASLIKCAARQGREYSAESVFKLRCDAIMTATDGGSRGE